MSLTRTWKSQESEQIAPDACATIGDLTSEIWMDGDQANEVSSDKLVVSSVPRISECVIMERTLAFPGFSSVNRLECLRRARFPGQGYLPSGLRRVLCANDHHDMDRAVEHSAVPPPTTPTPPAAFIISGWPYSCSQASPRNTQPEAPARTRGT